MLDVLVAGLQFPEGSRWRDGKLWFSDMLAGKVYEADVTTGALHEVLALDGNVSGLGWLPDGSLLVSNMLERTLIRVGADGSTSTFADLSEHTPWPINDLVTDARGRTYLGGFGYDYHSGAPARASDLYRISPDGSVAVVASDLAFPNGSVILPGTSTLVVAETMAAQLTAFDIDDSGALVGRRVWASLPEGSTPDGICVDSQHGIWVGSVFTGEFLRVVERGGITDRIDVSGRCAIDCVLGGPDGRTLLLLTSAGPQDFDPTAATGRIEATTVAVPGPLSSSE